jgi:hypothetical protein
MLAAHAPLCAQLPATASSSPANRFSILAGLGQLALGGGNVEVNWFTKRMYADYSHGFDVSVPSSALPSRDRSQFLKIRMPWTTGFGIGYRVTRAFDVRIEPKMHRYEVSLDGAAPGTPLIARYTTATLGVGAYYHWYPFASASRWARQIVVAPSLRYWPNVWTSLSGDSLAYANARTGRTEVMRAARQGLPMLGGLLPNVSVGLTF